MFLVLTVFHLPISGIAEEERNQSESKLGKVPSWKMRKLKPAKTKSCKTVKAGQG